MRDTRAVIHLNNLRSNIHNIKSLTNSKLCVAIKANAYGHGAIECAKAVIDSGAEMLAIATVSEGIQLRENGIICKLLLLSLCSPSEIKDAVKYGITPFVFDQEYISLFSKECMAQNKKNYPVHLAIDSGMGRIGCYKEDAAELAVFINSCDNLVLDGMGTHFANSDTIDNKSIEYTKMQYENFTEAVENVKKAGINPGICHCSNSAAISYLKDFHMDMVRAGIICYGYYAGDITKDYLKNKNINLELKPVMTFETKICAIRKCLKGMSVGYGSTWTAAKDTNIAVIPVGYADGMLRSFSTNGVRVTIGKKDYPIVGRICMDQCMIDIGNDPVNRWDKVIIFGSKEESFEDAESIAQKTGTISYEITSCISSRVPRVFQDA